MKKSSRKNLTNKTGHKKSLKSISNEAQKIIDWNKKGIGLSANLQRSIKNVDVEINVNMVERFMSQFEEESIIQEMYEWFNKAKNQDSDDELSREIFIIIEAFFDRLKKQFNFDVIEEPAVIIPTPSPKSRYYRFENKYSNNIKYSKVIKCGLKVGNKVIAPCILLQVEGQQF